MSPQGRALMLCGHDPQRPAESYWFSIGGGVELGESLRQAAVRELWEETGIELPPSDLGEPLVQERHTYRYNGVHYDATSTFFVLPVAEEIDVQPAAPNPGEVITGSRWWDPVAFSGASVSNPGLPQIVADAVSAARSRTARTGRIPDS